MRALVLILLLSGCSGNWKDFNYGPGDWIAENTDIQVSSVYTYEKVWNPDIFVLIGDTSPCARGQKACSKSTPEVCYVYLPERYSPSLKAHEMKHCYGYDHPDFPYTVDYERRQGQLRLMRAWYPKGEQIDSL